MTDQQPDEEAIVEEATFGINPSAETINQLSPSAAAKENRHKKGNRPLKMMLGRRCKRGRRKGKLKVREAQATEKASEPISYTYVWGRKWTIDIPYYVSRVMRAVGGDVSFIICK
jgi:hypothetical protein